MAFKRHVAARVGVAAILVLGLSLLAESGETYKARLSAVPADARTRADLTGPGYGHRGARWDQAYGHGLVRRAQSRRRRWCACIMR